MFSSIALCARAHAADYAAAGVAFQQYSVRAYVTKRARMHAYAWALSGASAGTMKAPSHGVCVYMCVGMRVCASHVGCMHVLSDDAMTMW